MVNGSHELVYRDEIEHALRDDGQRIGDVFRALQNGQSVQAIAREWGTNVSTVQAYQNSMNTLLECRRIVGGVTKARQNASMVRSFLRRHGGELSPDTRQKLGDLADDHELFANNVNVDVIIRENEEIERGLESDDQNQPGIYVYTYPHYYREPVRRSEEDFTENRTFLKIGVTEASEGASKRIQQQIGEVRTAIPESPLILRIYNKDGADLKETEKKIQGHLDAADHSRINRQRGAGVGMEWFLTHLKFLDSTADLLGLEAKYRHQDEDEG